MITLQSDPDLRRPAPAGALDEARRRGTLLRRRALSMGVGVSLAVVAVGLAPAFFSSGSDRLVGPDASSVTGPAAPDQKQAAYALRRGVLTLDADGRHAGHAYTRVTASSTTGAFAWTAVGREPTPFTVQLDSTDGLRTVHSVDFFLPRGAGRSDLAFQFTPLTPVSLDLRVGQSSSGTWTEGGHVFTLTCKRPARWTWTVSLDAIPALGPRDISPTRFVLTIDQARVAARSPLQLRLHAVSGDGSTLDVDLEGTVDRVK